MWITVDRPDSDATWDVLRRVGELLNRDVCWSYLRAYHFQLEQDGWTLAVTPESAGRFRLELCRWTVPRDMLLAFQGDDDRLAGAVDELLDRLGAGTRA